MRATKNHRMWIVLSAVMVSVGAGLCTGMPATLAQTEPLVIVVGQAFAVNDISLADLKTAFNGRIVHIQGKQLVPINHVAGAPMRVEFDRLVLQLEPEAVGRYWVDRRIRDEGIPPRSVPSPELAMRVVAAIPMAVTYARRSMLIPTVKVLTVDGRAAGQPGYALTPRK